MPSATTVTPTPQANTAELPPDASASSEPPPPATSSEPQKSKTTPITAAAKTLLHNYFVSLNWPLNRRLPRGQYDANLQQIVNKYALNRGQIGRQLNNYKKEKFGNSKIELKLNDDDVKERIMEGLGMTPIEFVDSTLRKLSKSWKDVSSSSSDFDKFTMILDDFPPGSARLVDLLIGLMSDSECCTLLSNCVDHWIDSAAEEFPKTTAQISGSELQFQVKKDEQKGSFIKQWVHQYKTFGLDENNMSSYQFQYFGSFLHDCLFAEWAYSAIDCEKPAVSFPDECLVSKYARPVIYYVAGWTLHSMSKALTIAKANREMYTCFASDHCLGEVEARNLGLPISLVLRRKRRAKMFCTEAYFLFICFVETVYLANLTLEMMMAYANGDIIYVIKTAILESEIAREKFMAVCNNDDTTEVVNEEEAKLLMKYILERYANMRGSYFVKFLKGTGNGGSSVDKLVNSQATRTKVVSAAASSKAAAEAGKKRARNDTDADEEALWIGAGESVLEKSNQLDLEEEEDSDI